MKSIDNLFKDSGVDQEYYQLELARISSTDKTTRRTTESGQSRNRGRINGAFYERF